MMTCEEVELELPEPSEQARAHLETCAACRDTAKLLGLATLPPLSEAERAMLAGLATSLPRAVSPPRRDGLGRRVASLALAAGLGALVASAAMLKLSPEPRIETRTVLVTPPEIPVLEVSDELDLSDDEVFFEVGWPSPTEGDL